MKKKVKVIALLLVVAVCAVLLAGCEESYYKTGNRITGGKDVQTFTYAWIKLGDTEVVKGFISQWRDYENSDTVQIMINGKFYLTHYTNVIMVADPEQGALNYSDPDWFTKE